MEHTTDLAKKQALIFSPTLLIFSLALLIFSLASRFYAGSRPAASHSVRSTQSEEQPNSLNRCALWPAAPWTTLWPVDGGHSRKRLHPDRPPSINGLTTAPLHRGARPPGPPAVHPHSPPFKKNSLEQPNSRTALRGFALPLHWSAGSRGPVRGSAPGGAAQGGRGAARTTRKERPRRGPRRPASEARSPPKDGRRGAGRPPPGG